MRLSFSYNRTPLSNSYFLNFFFIASVMMLIAITIANRAYKKATSFQEEIHAMFQKTKQIIANTIVAITISLIRFFIRIPPSSNSSFLNCLYFYYNIPSHLRQLKLLVLICASPKVHMFLTHNVSAGHPCKQEHNTFCMDIGSA